MKIDFVKKFTVPDKSMEPMADAVRELQRLVMEQSKEIEELKWMMPDMRSRQP